MASNVHTAKRADMGQISFSNSQDEHDSLRSSEQKRPNRHMREATNLLIVEEGG